MKPTLLLLPLFSLTVYAGIGRDANGWTTFTPSPDTRLVYVSSSDGDDATAQWYAPTDGSIGDDPFNPTGAVNSFASISNALTTARNGYPDWLLLKRGDVFYEVLKLRDGRTPDERFLYSAYGTATNRPVLKTGVRSAISSIEGIEYAAFVSLEMYANGRDPNSPDYMFGTNGNGGTLFSINNIHYRGTNIFSLLIEDCLLRFGASDLVIQNLQSHPGSISNIVIRRNVLVDAYSTNSHSQGMYSYHTTLLLEENVFDHNGWLIQYYGSNAQASGAATMFNHDTYFSTCHDTVFRGNIFLRSSSIGNKWTANDGVNSSTNLSMIDNLYIDGEIGISAGGNNPGPVRFANMTVLSNVFIDIGLSRPTRRTLGWGIEIKDWDDGLAADNLLIRNTNEVVNNVYGINITGTTSSNIVVRDNIIHGLHGATGIIVTEHTSDWGIVLSGNKVQFPGLSSRLAQASTLGGGIHFEDTTYYSDRMSTAWFRVQGSDASFGTWQTAMGEESAVAHKLTFHDPERNLCTYMTSIGETGTYQAFIAAVRGQSKMNWRPELCAHAINAYLRAGFQSLDVATKGLPDAIVGQPYNAVLGAVHASGTVAWTVHAGTLPAGLTLSSSGVISGTPAAVGVLGQTNSMFTVLARDEMNVDPKTLRIAVVPEPVGACGAVIWSASSILMRRRRSRR